MDSKGPYSISHEQVEHILSCLRSVDYAGRKLEENEPGRHAPVIAELKAATDGVYGLLTQLAEKPE